MADETATILTFLLDETGSMQSIKDDTIGGFNAYLGSLKQDPRPLEFTLLKFDSNHVEKVCVGMPLADVQLLTPETYQPGASTPLIDAAYKAIEATQAVVDKRTDTPHVLVVIQTDGQENCSTEHSLADLAQLVKVKTALGWGFVFLGAGMDAFAEAGSMGIAAGATLSYGRGKSAQTFHMMAENTQSYRMSGQATSLHFTPEQRQETSDDLLPSSTHAAPVPPVSRKRDVIVDDIVLTSKT